MINANELRIGNLVKLNNPKARPKEVGNFAEVLAIDSEHSFNEYKGTVTIKPFGELNSYGQFFVFIEPIELTPEILEKCGAENFPSGKNDFSLHGLLITWAECRNVYTHNGKELPNLHTLQNYIFALTGKELNYQP